MQDRANARNVHHHAHVAVVEFVAHAVKVGTKIAESRLDEDNYMCILLRMVRRKKPGRRPTPGPKRNERIPVLVTPELKARIVADARREGSTTSEWMQGAAILRLSMSAANGEGEP